MGYHMEQVDSRFRIPAKKHSDALAAVKGLCESQRQYAWVYNGDVQRAKNLEAALRRWRWDITLGPTNDAEGIEFCGEKAGDDFSLFQAIAPFVEPGSFIEMLGEDGERWRWLFDGQTCVEKYAKTVWDDPSARLRDALSEVLDHLATYYDDPERELESYKGWREVLEETGE